MKRFRFSTLSSIFFCTVVPLFAWMMTTGTSTVAREKTKDVDDAILWIVRKHVRTILPVLHGYIDSAAERINASRCIVKYY
jgi:hypothetical protein